MPAIKLSDRFGLNVDVQPAATSALLKYARQLSSLRVQNVDLKKLGGLTLDQPAITSLRAGISFQDPLTLGDGAPALTVAAAAAGSLQVVRDTADLPGRDDDDPVELPADSCYVAFGIEATASAEIPVTSGIFAFGATPSSKVEMMSYSRFSPANGITLIDAVRRTVGAFAVPMRSSDLAGLDAGQVARVAVDGKLAFSGSANLLAMTNPLVSANLPSPLPALTVGAGGSVTIGISCAVLTSYQIVARKRDNGTVRLGWYRKEGTEFSVSAKAAEGISAGVAGTDLLAQLVGAISASPKADLAELAGAGVPDEQASAIAEAVKAAAARKLEIAAAAELSAGDSHSAAFLFDIAPALLTDESKDALDQALRGDLTKLHAPDLPGVTPGRSIWDKVRRHSLELDVNILGILNFRSVTALSLEGRVLYEPATGALVLSDRATAGRIQSTQVNFGADTQKLRHVLAESFLISAAWRAATLAEGPSLICSHSFFELQNSAGRGDIARKLSVGVALGLLSLDEVKLPDGASGFGRTLYSVSVAYDNDLLQRMFLDARWEPLPREMYETAGRNAIQFLVQPDDPDAVRRRPAIEDDLWRKMKAAGQPGFHELFPGVPSPLVAAIAADYSCIQWWAETMWNTAQQLAKVRSWTLQHPGSAPDDPEFQKLREGLARYLRDIAADTREEFGQPWGLVAMNQLAGRQAGAKILIAAPLFVLQKRRELAATTLPLR